MSEDVFHQAVHRAQEENLAVMLTGQGESLIHPQFEKYVSYLVERKVRFALTTNAALLPANRSAFLIDSGISRITFSISDFGEDYKTVYNLDFDDMMRNVEQFMAINAEREESRRSEVWIHCWSRDMNIASGSIALSSSMILTVSSRRPNAKRKWV